MVNTLCCCGDVYYDSYTFMVLVLQSFLLACNLLIATSHRLDDFLRMLDIDVGYQTVMVTAAT